MVLGGAGCFYAVPSAPSGGAKEGLLVQGSERPGRHTAQTCTRQAVLCMEAADWLDPGAARQKGWASRAWPNRMPGPWLHHQPGSLWVLKQSMERSGLLVVREETEKQRREGGEKIQLLQVPDDKALT